MACYPFASPLTLQKVLGVFSYMNLPEFHARRQEAFSNRLTQWHFIEQQFPTQLAGALRSAQLTANPRNRAAEEFAQGYMRDWITEAQEHIATQLQAGTIGREAADAWSAQLSLYEAMIPDMTLPDLDTGLPSESESSSNSGSSTDKGKGKATGS